MWSSCNAVESTYQNLWKKLGKKLKERPTDADLKVFIGTSIDALNEKFLTQLYSNGIGKLTAWALKQIQEAVKKIKPNTEREAIILVLDPEIQMLPVEHMPILRDKEVYRMPSVASIRETMKKNQHRTQIVGTKEMPCVDPKKTFLLIDPDGSFPRTRGFVEFHMKNQHWLDKGVQVYTEADIPSPMELAKKLREKDIYIYYGHMSGARYLPLGLVEKLKKCSASCLLGCGSGSSTYNGCFAPKCNALYYLQAGAPLVLCNLWEMLAEEGSKFIVKMLSDMLTSELPGR